MTLDPTSRMVITGIGVVSPNGIGREAFWTRCAEGASGIKPISLFETDRYRCHAAGEITPFVPQEYLESKGLRTLDRTTQLALVAAKLALEDRGLDDSEDAAEDIGVVLGSTMGSLRSISEFDLTGLREGPRYVNPALFPNAVINSPASQVSIRFNLRALNVTIATGWSASLDALGYALDLLRLGRAQALLVGGVEELCLQTFLGFYRLGLLAKEDHGPARLAPCQTRQRGTLPRPRWGGALLGEAAAFFVLEPLARARRFERRPYAEVLGYGTAFDPDNLHRVDPAGRGVIRAIRQALEAAALEPEAIDFISACANATSWVDDVELTALEAVFGERLGQVPVSAVKALIGESFSAAGAMQVAAAIGAMPAQPSRLRTALVPSFGLSGIASALVIRSLSDD